MKSLQLTRRLFFSVITITIMAFSLSMIAQTGGEPQLHRFKSGKLLLTKKNGAAYLGDKVSRIAFLTCSKDTISIEKGDTIEESDEFCAESPSESVRPHVEEQVPADSSSEDSDE